MPPLRVILRRKICSVDEALLPSMQVIDMPPQSRLEDDDWGVVVSDENEATGLLIVPAEQGDDLSIPDSIPSNLDGLQDPAVLSVDTNSVWHQKKEYRWVAAAVAVFALLSYQRYQLYQVRSYASGLEVNLKKLQDDSQWKDELARMRKDLLESQQAWQMALRRALNPTKVDMDPPEALFPDEDPLADVNLGECMSKVVQTVDNQAKLFVHDMTDKLSSVHEKLVQAMDKVPQYDEDFSFATTSMAESLQGVHESAVRWTRRSVKAVGRKLQEVAQTKAVQKYSEEDGSVATSVWRKVPAYLAVGAAIGLSWQMLHTEEEATTS